MNDLIKKSKIIMFNKIYASIEKEKDLTIEERVIKLMNDLQFIHAYFTFSIYSSIRDNIKKSLEKIKGV